MNYKYSYIPEVIGEIDASSLVTGNFKTSPNFIVKSQKNHTIVSTWVSSKRTRSYPYSRIYNTLSNVGMKKITIFPIVKDEGLDGDRDYTQWDTFSICSYLGVYTIPAYYVRAEKNQNYSNKVTNQEFDYSYIGIKIRQIQETKVTPQEWNNNERNNTGKIVANVINGYKKINKETGVAFKSLDQLKANLAIMKNSAKFKKSSQKKSIMAQHRESITKQPKEKDFGFPKGKINLTDALGEKYFWTVDGFYIKNKQLFLIEMKHSKNKIPSLDDIKDALFKFHFYNSIIKCHDENNIELKTKPALLLSSGELSSSELKNSKKLDPILKECQQNDILMIFAGKDSTKQIILSALA